MSNEIYTATGCVRCKITKRYLKENDIGYDEFDFKAEGKENFAQFYRSNRKNIFRDQDGVEFPVFFDGTEIRQGVSVIIGYLLSQGKLDGFVSRSLLHGGWIDGFDISGGDPAQVDHLVSLLSYLKANSLKIQVTTNGRNASVLETLLAKNLCDRVIMEVKGPAGLYQKLAGQEITESELKQSIQLAATASEYAFYTTIAPLERARDRVEYLTSEELGETAKLIEEATASKKHPYELRTFDPQSSTDEQQKAMEPLPSSALFKYRTAARRYQVATEIGT